MARNWRSAGAAGPPAEDVIMASAIEDEASSVSDGMTEDPDKEVSTTMDETGTSAGNDSSGSSSGASAGSSAESSTVSSSSDSERPGLAKPSQKELTDEAKALRKEADDLRLRMLDDKLVLLEKRLKDIEADDDQELNERLQDINTRQSAKRKATEERFRLRTEMAQKEYESEVRQVKEENESALHEIVLARDRKTRLRTKVHLPPEIITKGRKTAGHEFPAHVEQILDKQQIEEDLDAIKREFRQMTPPNGSEGRRHSTH